MNSCNLDTQSIHETGGISENEITGRYQPLAEL
jgi:hypothetical protein